MKTALLFTLLGIFFFHPVYSQVPDFDLKAIIGTPITFPNDIAINKSDEIFILDKKVINKIDKEGYILGKVPVDDYSFTLDMDNEGNFYVANRNCMCVVKYNEQGKVLLQFGSYGTGVGQLKRIGRTALDLQGNVYLIDYDKKQILKYDLEGRFVQSIGASVTEGGTLSSVRDIGLDAMGNIYVLESSGDYESITKAHKFSPTGELLKILTIHQQGTGYNPNEVSSFLIKDDGGIYTVHRFYRDILEYDSEGNLIRKFAGHGSHESGLLGDNIFLKLDQAGNIYAADALSYKSSIKKYSPEGTFLKKYGNDKKFTTPVFDRYNNLHVYDEIDKTIHVYDTQGKLKLKFSALSGINFYGEKGLLSLDRFGNIYIYYQWNSKYLVRKFNNKGFHLSSYELELPKSTDYSFYATCFGVDRNGIMYIGDRDGSFFHKVNATGNYIGTFGKAGIKEGQFLMPSSVAFDAIGFIYVQDYGGNRIQKFSPSGNFIMAYGDTSRNRPTNFSNLSVDDHGNAALSYSSNYDNSVIFYNSSGQLLKEHTFWHYGIGLSKDGSSFAALLPDRTVGIYTHKNYSHKSYITGSIFEDVNKNCVQDKDDRGLQGIVVVAEPGPYYGISDNSGSYSIAVDSGTYTVRQVLNKEEGRTIEQICSTSTTVPLKVESINVSGPNFGNKVTISPYLTVSVSSDRRRRCFESVTKVNYSNTGFAPAVDAKIYLQLPKEVEFLTADKPYTRQPNGTYVFDVGTVAAGESKTITIQDLVTCGDESVRGLTVCTKVWMTPANSIKSTPFTTVTGACNYGTGLVRFVIKNSGQGDMKTAKEYRLYQDTQLATIENYKLAAGDSLVLLVPGEGKTLRLEADQPGEDGRKKSASYTVEACRILANRTAFSTGFVNALPTDDEEAEVSESCLQIIDSYDPNDKLVTPTGLTEENYTPTGATLKYKIRFQNTGTDVAYRVVVVDTLSQHLDISTLQMGAASHKYRLDVSGKGLPVLTWTFDNIMLPDSNSNEPESHGYIQFVIKPKANLPEKTAVTNFADIFFDYNSPVRTNITTNRIFDMPPVVQEANKISADEIIASPTILDFSPAAGKYNSDVIITGSKFSNSTQANKVYFNGVLAQVTGGDEQTLRVKVPTGSSTGSIKIITEHAGINTSTSFEVYQPPIVDSMSPIEGVIGSEVVLQGRNLSADLVENIQLGSLVCEIIKSSQNSITVRIPGGATTNTFSVTTKGGSAQSNAAFKVWYSPRITGVDKARQRVGGKLLLQGIHFAAVANRNMVQFDNVQAEVLQASETVLEIRVPAGAKTGLISVTTPGGTASRAFEVIPAPVITEVFPAKGSVGTVVELRGEHFNTFGIQDTVTFQGEKALVLSASANVLLVRVPRGAVTGNVIVAGIGGRDEIGFEVEQLTHQQAIVAFPNPSSGKFTIDFVKADFNVQAVQVYNATGRLIFNENFSDGHPEKLDINLTGKAPGMYVIVVQTERGQVIKKLTLL